MAGGEGCTNRALKGGVCIKHEARVIQKLCSIEGCTSHIVKGEECVLGMESADGCFYLVSLCCLLSWDLTPA
jgi:hypothetical protein